MPTSTHVSRCCRYSRASYLAGLLRPQIIRDLKLEQHGFEYIMRDPSSFTPASPSATPDTMPGAFLVLGADEEATRQSIAQFSERDANRFPLYEEFLGKAREVSDCSLFECTNQQIWTGCDAGKMHSTSETDATDIATVAGQPTSKPFRRNMARPASGSAHGGCCCAKSVEAPCSFARGAVLQLVWKIPLCRALSSGRVPGVNLDAKFIVVVRSVPLFECKCARSTNF